MAFNFYDTHTLLASVQQLPPLHSLLLDRYFPTNAASDVFATDDVLVAYRTGSTKATPFVAPRTGGITILREDTETALIYVYRPDTMVRELSRPEIISFLVSTGYQAGTIDQMLEQLRSRLHGSEEFPHEIGVFLGYPLNDVLGFIKNHGSNCKGMGDWKVYGDLGEAQKTFAKFKKCREIYANLWHQGRTIWQLTVAA